MTPTRRVASVVVLAAVMVVAAIAMGAAAPAVAQDDEVPALPAVYHGELTVADGELDEPVLVEAVADGEVQDSMLTDEDGAIGGPTIADDKLEVQQPDDGVVEFHVAGEPVTILELDGQTVNEESIDWAEATQEIELEVDAEQLEPDIDVSIDDTNSPVQTGADLTVDVTLSNLGASEVTEEVTLESFDGEVVDTETVTLDVEESATETLTWSTDEGDAGDGTVTVNATDNSDTAAVEIADPDVDVSIDDTNSPVDAGEELSVDVTASNLGDTAVTEEVVLESFDGEVVDTATVTLDPDESVTETVIWETTEDDAGDGTITVNTTAHSDTVSVDIGPGDITDPDPGGVGGQPSMGDDDGTDAEDGDDDETPALDDGIIHTETQQIATSEEFDIAQVRFTEGAGVASITWDTAEIPTEAVGVETYEQTPAAVDPIPGAMISISELTLPATASDTPATIELRADRERLAAADADVADLRVVRFTDGSWEPLETTVSDETDDAVMLEAETPGFSFVAVQATSEPTATIDAPDTVTQGEEVTLSGADSSTQYGEITAYDWTVDGASATGETVAETFDESGDVTVELTVTNDAGETDTATAEVSVAEPEPEPEETDDGIPGFGVIVALVALLAAAGVARRRA